MRSPLAVPRALLALVFTAFALAGCMKVDAVLTIHDDDTVSGDIVLAVDRRLSAVTGESEEKLVATLGLDRGKLPPTASLERYQDDAFTGLRVSFDDTPLAQFTGTGGRDSFTLVRAGDEYAFAGTVDLRTVDLLDPGVKAFADRFTFRISVTFPGEVVEHNGTLAGRTVTWQPKAGETLNLRAKSRVSPQIPWVPLVAAGVGLAVLGTVAAVFLLSRRRPGGTGDTPEPTLVDYRHDML
ncbi:MAG: hypothetical protein HOV79_04330 [Hamadaea sp.]|nr:hypothetical protein [Hamadaea sp.]